MEPSQGVQTDPHIHRLEESVVNQIAAGEVIQRPSSALKELLENAIDAGSKNIMVTVKEGGLKLLQITDDGCGIYKADLPILCHRHTTSKLSKYDDLASIGTLGFRGEALCSISFVSRLSVTTMRRGDVHAWKASFRDAEVLPPGPQPTAGVPGTALVVEDLFYNTPNRRKAMGSAAEEYNRIFDVVARYAIYSSDVGISLKRQKEARADIHTSPAYSRLESIRAIYGAPLAANLLPLRVRVQWPEAHAAAPAALPDGASFSVEGFAVNSSHAVKKSTLITFINGRAVECRALKRNIEAVYASLIAKAAKFWAFLDIRMPAAHLDVNIHPTKSEVAFLHAAEVVDGVRDAVERLLGDSNASRTFSTAAASHVRQTTIDVIGGAPDADRAGASTQRAKAGGDHKLVRTDHRDASMKPFLVSNPTMASAMDLALAGAVRRKGGRKRAAGVLDEAEGASSVAVQQANPPLVDVPSIEGLVSDTERVAHTGLTLILREHTYVGHVERGLVLLQHSTKLYLADMVALTHDLMYQQALRRFGQFRRIQMRPPVSLDAVVTIGLDAKEAAGTWTVEDGPKDTIAAMVCELLAAKAELLRDCFGIDVDATGHLDSLPMLIESYCPDLSALPGFFLALAADVDWADERACFQGVCEALARLYSMKPPQPSAATSGTEGGLDAPADAANKTFEWLIQHVALPAAKQHLKVGRHRATDGSVVEVAALEQLYRIFERC